MKDAFVAHDIQNLDMAAIEKRARELRAEALRNWILSAKTGLTGLFATSFGRRAEV